MKLLEGKKALIVGVASNRSIASGIALAMHKHGATIAFAYQSERLLKNVEKIAAECNSKYLYQCDAGDDLQIEAMFKELNSDLGKIDIIVHAVAFAPSDQLNGDYLQAVNREGFRIAHDISSYSLSALAKEGAPIMNKGGAILTLSYIGAEKAIPNYNVMGVAKASLEANVRYLAASMGPELGIRVNAISAGPIRTLAASGIKSFSDMLDHNEKIVPLRSNVSIEQVGNSAVFLCSELASAVTGEVLHVDSGFHVVGMI